MMTTDDYYLCSGNMQKNKLKNHFHSIQFTNINDAADIKKSKSILICKFAFQIEIDIFFHYISQTNVLHY